MLLWSQKNIAKEFTQLIQLSIDTLNFLEEGLAQQDQQKAERSTDNQVFVGWKDNGHSHSNSLIIFRAHHQHWIRVHQLMTEHVIDCVVQMMFVGGPEYNKVHTLSNCNCCRRHIEWESRTEGGWPLTRRPRQITGRQDQQSPSRVRMIFSWRARGGSKHFCASIGFEMSFKRSNSQIVLRIVCDADAVKPLSRSWWQDLELHVWKTLPRAWSDRSESDRYSSNLRNSSRVTFASANIQVRKLRGIVL